MTLVEISELMLQQMHLDLDAYQGKNETINHVDTYDAINWAQNEIAHIIGWRKLNITLSFDDVDTFWPFATAFDQIPTRIMGVYVDGKQVELLSYGDFAERYPNWRAEDRGEPIIAATMPDASLLLYPPPSADYVNESHEIVVDAFCLPEQFTALTGDDECSLPQTAHRAVALKACIKSARADVTSPDALNRLQMYRMEVDETIARLVKDKRVTEVKPVAMATPQIPRYL